MRAPARARKLRVRRAPQLALRERVPPLAAQRPRSLARIRTIPHACLPASWSRSTVPPRDRVVRPPRACYAHPHRRVSRRRCRGERRRGRAGSGQPPRALAARRARRLACDACEMLCRDARRSSTAAMHSVPVAPPRRGPSARGLWRLGPWPPPLSGPPMSIETRVGRSLCDARVGRAACRSRAKRCLMSVVRVCKTALMGMWYQHTNFTRYSNGKGCHRA